MTNHELTQIINNRIDSLKREINGFPRGGGFESLRGHLGKIQKQIDEIHLIADGIDREAANEY